MSYETELKVCKLQKNKSNQNLPMIEIIEPVVRIWPLKSVASQCRITEFENCGLLKIGF